MLVLFQWEDRHLQESPTYNIKIDEFRTLSYDGCFLIQRKGTRSNNMHPVPLLVPNVTVHHLYLLMESIMLISALQMHFDVDY